jgi:hypothetical protein
MITTDFKNPWNDPTTPNRKRKRLLATSSRQIRPFEVGAEAFLVTPHRPPHAYAGIVMRAMVSLVLYPGTVAALCIDEA